MTPRSTPMRVTPASEPSPEVRRAPSAIPPASHAAETMPSRPAAVAGRSSDSPDTKMSKKFTTARPALERAATAAAAVPPPASTSYGSIPPATLSRPTITHASTTATHMRFTTPASTPLLQPRPIPPKRPSILRRATSVAMSTLELGANTSLTQRNAPLEPTHWLDNPHRQSLIKTWDKVQEASGTSKFPRSITEQLVSVEKKMLALYPQLTDGEVPLSSEWIEYVLGVALRAPFSSGAKMGRWEILASNSAGARLNWGPW